MSYDKQQRMLERVAYQAWLNRGCPIGSPQIDWDYACRVLNSQLVRVDDASKQSHDHSTFDELGSDEDTPSESLSVSPFAAAVRTNASNDGVGTAQPLSQSLNPSSNKADGAVKSRKRTPRR